MLSKQQVADTFPSLAEHFVPAHAQGVKGLIQFELSGENGGLYWMKIADGVCQAGQGLVENPTLTLKSSADDWIGLVARTLNPTTAVMTGKVKLDGDWSLAIKFPTFFG